jgi:hypothetical protein
VRPYHRPRAPRRRIRRRGRRNDQADRAASTLRDREPGRSERPAAIRTSARIRWPATLGGCQLGRKARSLLAGGQSSATRQRRCREAARKLPGGQTDPSRGKQAQSRTLQRRRPSRQLSADSLDPPDQVPHDVGRRLPHDLAVRSPQLTVVSPVACGTDSLSPRRPRLDRPDGTEALQAARVVHRDGIRRHFTEHLSSKDSDAVSRALEQVRTHVRPLRPGRVSGGPPVSR